MPPPRILHVYKDVWPPVEGGIERTVHHMAKLTRGEFDPRVLVAAPGRRLSSRRRELPCGAPVLEVASFGRALSTPLAPGFAAAIRAERPDLLHYHFPHPTGEVAHLVAGGKIPAVVTYHSDVVRQRAALAFYRPFMHAFLRRARVVMPTSRRYLETSETLAPHADRCRVVPLGLPLEDYALPEGDRERVEEIRARTGPHVFFVGCLRYYKGLHHLIEAARLNPDLRVVLAGEGAEGERLRARAREAGVADRVEFLGRVDHATAVVRFHAASVFCLPACERSEAYGLCQIEAMACGLPVVSTDLPTGVPEINRDGETGVVVPPGDPRALAEALGRLLGDEAARRRMGEAGRARARANYTARAMAERVAEVYRETLGG